MRDEDAARVGARIVTDVRRGGDAALFAWTKKLDRISLTAGSVWIGREEMGAAQRRVEPEIHFCYQACGGQRSNACQAASSARLVR